MRQISCPNCHTVPKTHSDHGSILRCPSCDLRWTYILKEIELDSLYQDEVYQVVDNRKSIFERIIFLEAKQILAQAKTLFPPAKKLLDFGSGKGQFLAVSKEMGWEGVGIETSIERAQFATEKYGVNVLSDYYIQGQVMGGDYDLITLNHVLEHLPKPMDLLKELVDKNAKKLLYIEVPRADSWQAKIAGRQWMHWDIPKHLTHWTEITLVENVEKLGFRKVGKRSYSIHLGVLGMLQALLSRFGFRDNLILRLKRKKSLGLIILIGLTLPIAWIMELISVPVGRSGVLGIYFEKNG